MAINPILPVIIGAIQTRNKIKDINEADYDEVTGQFIDLASAEFFKDQTDQKKRIEKNNNFFNATERRYGTNVAEFAAKSNLFDGYDKITAFLSDIEGGTVIPLGLRKELGTNATIDIYDDYMDPQLKDHNYENNRASQAPVKPYSGSWTYNSWRLEGYIAHESSILLGNAIGGRKSNKYYQYPQYNPTTSSMYLIPGDD